LSHREAVLQLHRLHFVEKKGQDAVEGLIEARVRSRRAADALFEREHRGRLKKLHDDMDHKLKNSLQFGSTSIWTKEEQDKIEDLRRDPEEAKQKMTAHMKEVSKQYYSDRTAMFERVRNLPALNVRAKEEAKRIDEVRQDPEKAKAKMKSFMKERSQTFKDERAAMTERVHHAPPQSFWSKEQWAKIEELRSDEEESNIKMRTKIKQLAQTWHEESTSMAERVNNKPSMSFWTASELEDIEERRRDPNEAREKMSKHLRELERTSREERNAMFERLEHTPRKTFWTAEEKHNIEELRRDPKEAKENAEKDMRELARRYREMKSAMTERVQALPATTFLTPEARAQRKYVEELRQKQSLTMRHAHTPRF
jgi:hypothetical protein